LETSEERRARQKRIEERQDADGGDEDRIKRYKGSSPISE